MSRKPLSDKEKLDWLRLARTPNVGPVTFAQLLARFGSPEAAIDALPELSKRAGRKKPLRAPALGDMAAELSATADFGARIIAACEPDFPRLLASLDPPPPVLTVLGRGDLLNERSIAIVGARNASAAGRKIARDMATFLGTQGIIIVSGLARGIDGEAHAAALSTGTVAVVGGGVDHVYPPQHDRLYAAIAAEGVIVSESPFGHRATAKDFPRRNRLITGLALGTVVVEAAERSGSLISARTAGEQGREVMAVPGSPLDPRAAGTNKLIQQGAALVRSGEDVMDILSGLGTGRFEMAPGPLFENQPDEDAIPPDQISAVREALSPNPMPLDEIARAADIGAARCAAILMELELAGEATTLPGGLAMRVET
ncbi:MAG: DNA-processing protein DprA [Pseudomonadota bacterium]